MSERNIQDTPPEEVLPPRDEPLPEEEITLDGDVDPEDEDDDDKDEDEPD